VAVRRGDTGTQRDSAPQGEAKAVNDAVAASGTQGDAEHVHAQITKATPPTNGPTKTGNEYTDSLFGPTDRPNEPVTAGLGVPGPGKPGGPPPNFGTWMNDLVEASMQPDAPPQLKSMLKLIQYHIGEANSGV
jgi:hypothetical protein